jgi:hypothetical protein
MLSRMTPEKGIFSKTPKNAAIQIVNIATILVEITLVVKWYLVKYVVI